MKKIDWYLKSETTIVVQAETQIKPLCEKLIVLTWSHRRFKRTWRRGLLFSLQRLFKALLESRPSSPLRSSHGFQVYHPTRNPQLFLVIL